MAESCAFSRSGANSGSIGNCHDFAEDKDGKGSDRESFSCFLHPWECCSVAAVYMGAQQGRVMSPLAVSCLGKHKPFHQDSRRALISSQCWSQPVPALSISYLLSLTKYHSQEPSSHHYFLLEQSLFPLSPLLFLKGLVPFKNTVTGIKEATPLKLSSIVSKQNKVIESRKDVGLLT